ncbi:hypothetical protein [Pseudolysinimonas sp.]
MLVGIVTAVLMVPAPLAVPLASSAGVECRQISYGSFGSKPEPEIVTVSPGPNELSEAEPLEGMTGIEPA